MSPYLTTLCGEFRRRLRLGERVDADMILSENPDLASHPDSVIELILTEFSFRREAGERPDPEFWLLRYRRWREPLSRRFREMGLLPAHPTDTPATDRQEIPDADAPFTLPRLPPHEVLEEISRGGMGVVYRARDLTLGREVALKVLRGGCLATGPERRRFYREARAAARLSHPNIVPVLHLGTINGEDAFTMPLMSGGTLADAIRGRRPVGEVLERLLPVVRAVAHLHQHGMVHRDLKPKNVLIDGHGVPHVADFGLAWLRDGEPLTHTGQAMGTPQYMSPEQTLGRPAGPPADVWALGVMLYEALTGVLPFTGTRADLFQQIRQRPPAAPSSLRPDIPPGLEAVVLRCLQKHPGARYADAAELAAELERCQRGEDVRTPPPNRPQWWVGPRTALATLVILLLSLPLSPAPAGAGGEPGEATLAPTYRRLVRSEAVTLIGPHGGPRWSNWHVDSLRAPPTRPRGRELELIGYGPDYLRLLPGVPSGNYRVSARVAIRGGDRARVGLFARGTTESFQQATTHDSLGVRFAHPPDGPVTCIAGLHHLPANAPFGGGSSLADTVTRRVWRDAVAAVGLGPMPVVAAGVLAPLPAGTYHTLDLVCRGPKVEMWFDGERVWAKDLSARVMRAVVRVWWNETLRVRKLPPRPSPPYPVNGSVGLYVQHGEFKIREVRVIPLVPDGGPS